MSESDVLRLSQLLTKQCQLYEALAKFSNSMNEALTPEGIDPDTILAIASDRDEVMTKIKIGDKAVSEFLADGNRYSLLENVEPRKAVERLRSAIESTITADKENEEKLRKVKSGISKEFKQLMITRKTATGYGGSRKPVYAKFIDLKN